MRLSSVFGCITIIGLLAFTGCAGAVVGTDPANNVKYTGFTGHSVEADVNGNAQKILDVAQNVLHQHGFQTTVSGQNIDGRSSVNGAVVRIGRAGSDSSGGTTHVEVIATEADVCWNTDYAGQILQDIVTAK